MGRPWTIAVVGATGAVGREIVSILAERGFPCERLILQASERGAGATIDFGGETLRVGAVDRDALARAELVFLATPATVSRRLGPDLARSGVIVIDNSSAHRSDPTIPLVVPEVNAGELSAARRLIANPNCSTIIAMCALAPLHRAHRARRIVASTYQAASGAGAAALDELSRGSERVLSGDDDVRAVFPEGLAFNVIARIGSLGPDGETDEEAKMRMESRRLLGEPHLAVAATCVRVPVRRAHTIALVVEFADPVEVGAARDLLRDSPGLVVHDDRDVPTPRMAEFGDLVHCGRIRRVFDDPRYLALVAVSDQLRKGAALNAVQIAEHLALRS